MPLNEGQNLALKGLLDFTLKTPRGDEQTSEFQGTPGPVARALTRFGFRQAKDKPNLLFLNCRWDGWVVFIDVGQKVWRGMDEHEGVLMWFSQRMMEDLDGQAEPTAKESLQLLARWKIPVYWLPGGKTGTMRVDNWSP